MAPYYKSNYSVGHISKLTSTKSLVVFGVKFAYLLAIIISQINIIHSLTHQDNHPEDIELDDPDVAEDIHGASRCLIMKIPFCENVGYNKTMLPNKLNHVSQGDVINDINVFSPLVSLECSPLLRMFLCTYHAPMCFDNGDGPNPIQLYPCKSLCETVRRGCGSRLRELNFHWPPHLRCEQFPENTNRTQCVGNSTFNDASDNSQNSGVSITRDLRFVCPKNFEVNSSILYLNGRNYSNCAKPCNDVLLLEDEATIVRHVVLLIAVLCVGSSIFACLTFLKDMKRFRYPMRPMIFISACQLVVGTCYLIGYFTNNKIACNEPLEPPKPLPNLNMISTTNMGYRKSSCTFQFMTLYFAQLSTFFWWLMMTISWYLIAKLKWAPESVSGVARYFHFGSWVTPAVLTVYLTATGKIEGDSLTGTCYVNFSDQESMRHFVMYPILITIFLGIGFLVTGYKSLYDSRETLKCMYGTQTKEHHKLVLRLTIYSLAFIVFSLLLVYCHFYEESHLNSWMALWLSRICRSRDFSIPCPMGHFGHQKPHYQEFILKFFVTMGISLCTAIFMFSRKTLNALNNSSELGNIGNLRRPH